MKSGDKIAFNTANLVARVTGYRFELKNWMEQHKKTVEQTDEAAWRGICAEIAAAGYHAVEVWMAHADPSVMTAERLGTWKKIMAEARLTPIGYAGGFNEETVRVCEGLGIGAINGGMRGGVLVADLERLARKSGVRYNYENHPEKNAAEVLKKIEGGSEMIGVAVDTGWFGTQGADVTAEMKALGKLVRHVHIKDVKAGTHMTCPLGTGGVGLPGVIAYLKESGYAGWYSWEDEPEERNPMLIAAESRVWLEKQLAGASG